MKKIFITAIAFFAFSTVASAQVDKEDSRSEEVQDKIQQEPPREIQKQVENSTKNATVIDENNKNVRKADEKMKTEIEKSTGKENKNPAENSAVTRPKKQIEPAKQRN